MLSNEDFVNQTLVNNLFYLRTIREFCLNIQFSFLDKNIEYIEIAENLGNKCEELRELYVSYADGVIDQKALDYNFIVSPYTLPTEKMTERLFGVKLATHLTEKELEMKPGYPENVSDEMVEELNSLNRKTYALTKNFITFITEIYELEVDNKLFSYTYPHLLKYMIDEARGYLINLKRLISKQNVDPTYVTNFEYSYINTLKDSAIYIRNFVNPTAIDVFIKAQSYVMQFNYLMEDYKASGLTPENQIALADKTIEIVEKYADFMADTIERLLQGEIYFIVEPIFLDNLYTEVNYFLYGLKRFDLEDTSIYQEV